jgi:LPXTG-site transpeptidase (sortase) family protein
MPVRTAPPRHAKAPAKPRRSPAAIIGVIGELLLTAGLLVLLWVGYVLWGTGIQTDQAQDELRAQISAEWPDPTHVGTAATAPPPEEPPDEVELGDGYAILRIPRLGADWAWVVVQGVQLSDLTRGPGHYEDTANPGELGNVAIAGHRAGHGAPFADLDKIEIGDVVEVETATGVWTYTVDDGPHIIHPTEIWVVDPAPGQGANAEPTERRITLTTCHPRYGSSQRMYVSGVLSAGEEV